MIRRTLTQRCLFKDMSVFWSAKNPNERAVKRPWRHECIKGVLIVRWLGYRPGGPRNHPHAVMPHPAFLDWLEEHNLTVQWEQLCQIQGWKYFRNHIGYYSATTQVMRVNIPRDQG